MSIIRSFFNTLGLGKLPTPAGDDEKDFPDEAASAEGSLFTDFLEKDSVFNSSFGSASASNADFDFITNKTMKQQVKYEISLLEFPDELLRNISEEYTKENNHVSALKQEFCNEALNTPGGITERCDFLDRFTKIVDYKLHFFLTKHSQEILDGMQKIRSIEEDISTAQQCVVQSRAHTKVLTEEFQSSLLKLALLNKKKARISQIHDMLTFTLKGSIAQYRNVMENIKLSKFSKAYESLLSLKELLVSLLDVSKELKVPSLIIVEQLNDKTKVLETEIKKAVRRKLSEMVWRFSKTDYADISEYYELYSDWKNANNEFHPLFKDIREECKKIISKNAWTIIKARIKDHTRPNIKLKELCKKLSIHELVDSLNEIFKFHANMMYSHHSIISFHERKHTRSKQEESKQQKNGTVKKVGGFHHGIKALLMDDRKDLWGILQRKIGKIFAGTEERVIELSIPELFEILAICAKYLQIGEEFCGVNGSELREILTIKFCKRYVDEFHTSQLKNLKCIMETDLWKRLPLPDNYELPEFKSFMAEYPSDMDLLLKAIIEEPPKPRVAGKPRPTQGIFSQMVSVNPFTVEYRLITTKPKDTTQLKKPPLKPPLGEQEEDKGMDENIDEKEPGESEIVIEHTLRFRPKDAKLENQIICSPGLNLIKTLVKYIELLHIMKPCTDSILDRMMGTYEFYVYCIFLAFTPWDFQQKLLQSYPLEEPVEFDKVFTMLRIKSNYAALNRYLFKVHDDLKAEYKKISNTPGETIVGKGLLCPKLNEGVKLEETAALNAVYEKIVAVESCHYVFEVLYKMRNRILECLRTTEQRNKLNGFWEKNFQAVHQMTEYMYLTHPIKGVKLDTIADALDGGILMNSTTLEPSYYATRVVAFFQDLKEKIKYQGGGSLPRYCQKKFLQCALETIVDSVIEGYARNKKGHLKEIKNQTAFDLAWLANELTQVVGKGEKIKAIDRIHGYVRLMNAKGRSEVLKTIFASKELTYSAVCSIIRHHPALSKDNNKEILHEFQGHIVNQIK